MQDESTREKETATRTERPIEQKIQKLQELYADAPELGKAALENGLPDIPSESWQQFGDRREAKRRSRSASASGQGLGAHRDPSDHERWSKTTSRLAAATGRQLQGRRRGRHAPRHALRVPGQRHEAALRHRLRWRVGRLHRRLRDEDSRRHGSAVLQSEGWPGIQSPKVKDWIVERQISAEAWYVASRI